MLDKFISIIGYGMLRDGNRPAHTVVQSIDENLYAFYSHRGLESDLHHSYDYLYGRWLIENGYDSLGYDLEVWDECYQPDEPTNEIDMYIAIRKR
ncbi:MAG TPA: GyrI-like domain-containing protein [Cerasibacillus sp.]|uniref:GyrI-like domain-containing protein n=1 Tax=Cerasibacillus sp. TaxID=2498711 RepID=UPI002F41640F